MFFFLSVLHFWHIYNNIDSGERRVPVFVGSDELLPSASCCIHWLCILMAMNDRVSSIHWFLKLLKLYNTVGIFSQRFHFRAAYNMTGCISSVRNVNYYGFDVWGRIVDSVRHGPNQKTYSLTWLEQRVKMGPMVAGAVCHLDLCQRPL